MAEAEGVIDTIIALSIFYCAFLLVFCFTRHLRSWFYFLPCHVNLDSPQQPAAFSSFTIAKHYSISSSMSASPLARSLMLIHT